MLLGLATLAVLLWQPAPARAEISLDPELYLAKRECGVWIQSKRVGRSSAWIDIDDYDPEGNSLKVEEDSGYGWHGKATAEAGYGLYKVASLVDLSNDAYTYGMAYAWAGSKEYMVLSPFVAGTTPTITNIAQFNFILHGSVPRFWSDLDTNVDRCEVTYLIDIWTGNGSVSLSDTFRFDESGSLTQLVSGDFSFDIDEVITIATRLEVYTFLRPLRPEDAGSTWDARDHASNGAIELRFDNTFAWVGLTLPEGIVVAATASGATYPVNYTVPGIPEPAGLSLLAAGALILLRKRR